MFREILLIIISIILISCNFQKKEDKSAINKKDTFVKNNAEIVISKENTKLDTTKDFNETFHKTLDTLPPKKKERLIEDYKNNLDILVKKDVNNIGNDFQVIEKVTPRTQNEFSYYYNLTYSGDEKTEKFDKINELILKYSKEDKGDLFFLLLNMAEFVDGEYAEGYFYDIEDIIVKNKVKFCVIYKYLSKESKRRIEDIYLEVCKGIERPEEDDY